MDAGGRATHGFEYGSSYFAEPKMGESDSVAEDARTELSRAQFSQKLETIGI